MYYFISDKITCWNPEQQSQCAGWEFCKYAPNMTAGGNGTCESIRIQLTYLYATNLSILNVN